MAMQCLPLPTHFIHFGNALLDAEDAAERPTEDADADVEAVGL